MGAMTHYTTISADASALTVADSIQIIGIAKETNEDELDFTAQATLVSKVLGLDLKLVMGLSRNVVRSYLQIAVETMANVGFAPTKADKKAKAAAKDRQPVDSVIVGGHKFMIPQDLGKESMSLWIGIENLLRSLPKDIHPVEQMPYILGTLLRSVGAEYDVNTNADRVNIMREMLLDDACRITAFFFFSSQEFRHLLLQFCPAFETWTPLAKELDRLTSLAGGAARNSSSGSPN